MPKKRNSKPRKASTKSSRIKLATVQTLANRYARLRDTFGNSGAPCISCGLWKSFEELDGGHFIPTTISSTRFDERNINAQCHRCNRFLHGNQRGYFRGLEAKIGRDQIDNLEAFAGPKKWTQEELKELRTYYRDKINEIEGGIDPRINPNDGKTVLELFSQIRQL